MKELWFAQFMNDGKFYMRIFNVETNTIRSSKIIRPLRAYYDACTQCYALNALMGWKPNEILKYADQITVSIQKEL